MSQPRLRVESDGLLALVRETLDGIGRLIGEHLKLARLEFQVDVRAYGRSLMTLLLVGAVFALGYGLACVGLAIFLSRFIPLWAAFFLLAGAHIIVGSIAAGVAVGRLRGVRPMRETAQEMERSVSALTTAGGGNGDGLALAATLRGTNGPAPEAAGGGAWPTIRP